MGESQSKIWGCRGAKDEVAVCTYPRVAEVVDVRLSFTRDHMSELFCRR